LRFNPDIYFNAYTQPGLISDFKVPVIKKSKKKKKKKQTPAIERLWDLDAKNSVAGEQCSMANEWDEPNLARLVCADFLLFHSALMQSSKQRDWCFYSFV
jgi:hypothetical protein